MRIAASGDDLNDFPWVPASVRRPGLDGRAAIAIVSATEFRGTCITLRRSIDRTPSGSFRLNASFGELLLHRRRKHVDLSTLPEMVSAVSLILEVDAERMLRRAIERAIPAEVTVQIGAGDLPGDMTHSFVEAIAENLRRRVVAIEPSGIAISVFIEPTHDSGQSRDTVTA